MSYLSLFVILERNTEHKGGCDVISSDCVPARSGCDNQRCDTKLRCANDVNSNNVHNSNNIKSVNNAFFSRSSRNDEISGRNVYPRLADRGRHCFRTQSKR